MTPSPYRALWAPGHYSPARGKDPAIIRGKENAMPLVTLTVRKPKSTAFKNTVLDAVHAALVSSGVPATDKFQRVLELDADSFRFDPSYPDLQSTRDDNFV